MIFEDNPKVNRELDDRAMDLIDHALGRPTFPLKEAYRNYFATSEGNQEALHFEQSHHWKRSGERFGMMYYSVTNEGRKALADHLRTLPQFKPFVVKYWEWSKIVTAKSRAAARYNVFLDVSDCGDISFSEFLKVSSVKAYA
ncbi:hypothetical protein IAE29_21940 [Ochrobactrum sp. S46]|nr:hypothetical protein [Ochrobactrum sp. S45]MBK0045998.1 hypothetical protein [Ochrobactrum sp. S46]